MSEARRLTGTEMIKAFKAIQSDASLSFVPKYVIWEGGQENSFHPNKHSSKTKGKDHSRAQDAVLGHGKRGSKA